MTGNKTPATPTSTAHRASADSIHLILIGDGEWLVVGGLGQTLGTVAVIRHTLANINVFHLAPLGGDSTRLESRDMSLREAVEAIEWPLAAAKRTARRAK